MPLFAAVWGRVNNYFERDSKMNTAANENQSGDLLLGADAIASFLGITRRQTYRLVYDRVIPSFKAGGTVAARKSSLVAWMAAQEAA
jgi:excisionase family DNA binding protein